MMISLAEICRSFEERALAFVKERHLEREVLLYAVETSAAFAQDIWDSLTSKYRPYSELPGALCRNLVLDPFDNPSVFDEFAEYCGYSYTELFDYVVNGIEPDRTA